MDDLLIFSIVAIFRFYSSGFLTILFYLSVRALSRKGMEIALFRRLDSSGIMSPSDNRKEKMVMLETGIQAPSFSLPDQNGNLHTLEEYRGRKVVLYFYPRDNTPGCTKQACGFRDLYPQFTEKGAVVLGVSKDSVASHKKFEEKFGLPFTLLSDPELSCIQAYDVWQEKNMYGKKTMGVVRTTYLIDEQGMIVKAFGKVKAAENPAQMLDEL